MKFNTVFKGMRAYTGMWAPYTGTPEENVATGTFGEMSLFRFSTIGDTGNSMKIVTDVYIPQHSRVSHLKDANGDLIMPSWREENDPTAGGLYQVRSCVPSLTIYGHPEGYKILIGRYDQ